MALRAPKSYCQIFLGKSSGGKAERIAQYH